MSGKKDPDEILGLLAAQSQNHEDRLKQYESVFGESIIVPGNRVTSILSTVIIFILSVCLTFAFAFWLIRPL